MFLGDKSICSHLKLLYSAGEIYVWLRLQVMGKRKRKLKLWPQKQLPWNHNYTRTTKWEEK